MLLLYWIHVQLEENGTTVILTDDPQQENSTVIGKMLNVVIYTASNLSLVEWCRKNFECRYRILIT